MVEAAPFQQALATNDDGRPTVTDLQGDDPLAQAARKYWLNDKAAKFKPSVIKTDFYDVLEKGGFKHRSLLILENLQFFEK